MTTTNPKPARFAIRALFGAAAFLLASATASRAQYPGVQGAVEREIQTLEQKKHYATSLVEKGNAAISDDDYESAYTFFKAAVDALPLGGTATADVRAQALDGFCSSAVLLARQRAAEGRSADARAVLEVVLGEKYAPNDTQALALRAKLMDPAGLAGRGTLTPQHLARTQEVKELLLEGEGFFASGRYDLAFKRCEQALNIDKYNIAARRLMERVNLARTQYAETAYNETRGELLAQVAKGWELPPKKFAEGPVASVEPSPIAMRGTENINAKLDSITIPRINFTDSSIREAIDFLKKRSVELDGDEMDPDLKGVNIVLKVPPGSPEEGAQITLEIENVPLKAALEYVAQAAGLKVKVDPYAVVIVPSTENTDVLLTKEYKVPPNFIQAAAGSPDSGSSPGVAGRSGALQFLEAQGVLFPEGASANYVPSTSRLIVKNTQPNLDIIDALVETAIATPPTQIEIEAKFLDVTQNNLNELGFDWLLGQFSLAGGSGVYGGGGTEGFGRSIDNNAYPLINPGTGLPVGATTSTSGPVTAGNRGGAGGYGTAVSVNAIDALLLGATGVSGAAPGILSVSGVFTNPQFQVVLRALSQKKGIDLVSAPKITTQSGKQASIEIIREFRYPTEFEPPQLSASNGAQYTPVVPNAPSGWETKNTGITLEVEPTVAPDAYTIDLRLVPRIIEFDGFINYGSPINATVAASVPLFGLDGGILGTQLLPSATFVATENVMNQPVFSTREVETQVSVYDGQTVVMGGLMREDVQKVQDKVPILGDIPLAGRLFRSNVDQRVKKNLIMFVTASLIDPAGQPLITDPDGDEIVPEPSAAAVEAESIVGDPLSMPLAQ